MWTVFSLLLFHLFRTKGMSNALSGEKWPRLVLHLMHGSGLLSIIIHQMRLSNKAPNSFAKWVFKKYEEREVIPRGGGIILRFMDDWPCHS